MLNNNTSIIFDDGFLCIEISIINEKQHIALCSIKGYRNSYNAGTIDKAFFEITNNGIQNIIINMKECEINYIYTFTGVITSISHRKKMNVAFIETDRKKEEDIILENWIQRCGFILCKDLDEGVEILSRKSK